MKHLKTPLTSTRYRASDVIVRDTEGFEFTVQHVGKAADVVLACNAHDQLVRALKAAKKRLNDVGMSTRAIDCALDAAGAA